MPTLFEALSDGSYDLQNKRDLSSDFSRKLLVYRKEIVNNYTKAHTDLSKLIAQVAKKNNLNKDQISRIIEEVNNQVYLIEYDKLKNSVDKDVEFTIATLPSVLFFMKNTEKENKKPEKVAFSPENFSFEKVASYAEPNPFSGAYGHKFGDLSVAGPSKSEILLKKIANKITSDEDNLEKISTEINAKAVEISESLVQFEKMGYSANEILNTVAKDAGFDENEYNLIKAASEDRVAGLIENKVLPSNFKINFEMNFEKTAATKTRLSLGKYSLAEKTASINLPRICLSNNRPIRGYNDLLKIAEELHVLKDDFLKKNEELVSEKEKLASANINFQTAN